MTTALYRKSSGEVQKISVTDQQFSQVDTTYWGVLTDPTTPDGIEVRNMGQYRVLGFAKIAEVGSNNVRNATQEEIDTFAPAQVADEKLQDKAGGQALFSVHPRFRKVFKAMLKELLTEINRTKNPKAQMSIVNGVTVQAMTSKTWEQITTFNTAQGVDSESFDTLSVDLVNSKIVSTTRGRHYVAVSVSFEGDPESEFLFEIAVNGNRNADIRTKRKLGAFGDVGNCSGFGFVAFPVEPPGVNEITLHCRNMENNDRDLLIKECQIVVFRLENNIGRALPEMMTAIDGQFSEED